MELRNVFLGTKGEMCTNSLKQCHNDKNLYGPKKSGNVCSVFLLILGWNMTWTCQVQHPSHSVCVSVCICKSVFAGSRTLLSIQLPFLSNLPLSSNATSRIFFCYYYLWMDLDASLWQWRSGKQSGNHITGRRNTVATHNHSIIRVLRPREQRRSKREKKPVKEKRWIESVRRSPIIYSPLSLYFVL